MDVIKQGSNGLKIHHRNFCLPAAQETVSLRVIAEGLGLLTVGHEVWGVQKTEVKDISSGFRISQKGAPTSKVGAPTYYLAKFFLKRIWIQRRESVPHLATKGYKCQCDNKTLQFEASFLALFTLIKTEAKAKHFLSFLFISLILFAFARCEWILRVMDGFVRLRYAADVNRITEKTTRGIHSLPMETGELVVFCGSTWSLNYAASGLHHRVQVDIQINSANVARLIPPHSIHCYFRRPNFPS